MQKEEWIQERQQKKDYAYSACFDRSKKEVDAKYTEKINKMKWERTRERDKQEKWRKNKEQEERHLKDKYKTMETKNRETVVFELMLKAMVAVCKATYEQQSDRFKRMVPEHSPMLPLFFLLA